MIIYNKDIYIETLKCHKEAESETSNLSIHINSLVGNIFLYVVLSKFKVPIKSTTLPIPQQVIMCQK
jgi:hypothetical protein